MARPPDARGECPSSRRGLRHVCQELTFPGLGTGGDFQGLAVFLASSASDCMHGTIVTVDGGWMGR